MYSRQDRRATLMAAIGSLAVHVLLLDAALGGGGMRARNPAVPGLGASSVVSDEQSSMMLILLDGPPGEESQVEPAQSASSHGTLAQSVQLTVVAPEPVREPAFEIEPQSGEREQLADAGDSDVLGRARQFGLYLGQIQARIERAWLRPRSAIGDAEFECTAQVRQDRRGEVLEVMLLRCNGEAAWQLSLVNAIERASPLPAPPDPVVFSESIRVSFRSHGFDPSASPEGFEPERTVLAADAPPPMVIQE
jgi:hypothetical protein